MKTIVELALSNINNKIYCFHTGGGGLGVYEKMTEYLKPHGTVLGLEDPYIYDGFRYQSIPQLAGHHVDTILDDVPSESYTLIGFCSGGPIAFEAACQLSMEGEKIDQVIIVGDRVAMFDGEEKQSMDFLQQEIVNRFGATLPEFAWSSLSNMTAEEAVEALAKAYTELTHDTERLDIDVLKRCLVSSILTRQAARHYKPVQADFDITVIGNYPDENGNITFPKWVDGKKLTSGNLNYIEADKSIHVKDLLSDNVFQKTINNIISALP